MHTFATPTVDYPVSMPVRMQNYQIPSQEPASQQSLLTAMNEFVKAVDTMDDTVMIPSKLRDMTAASGPGDENKNGNQAIIPVKNGHQVDLHSFYVMLNAVKTELATGPKHEDEDGQKDGEMEGESAIARQTAELFRHHLRGLFNVLHQLTDTADVVTQRYQEDVGEYTSKLKRHRNSYPTLPSYLWSLWYEMLCSCA